MTAQQHALYPNTYKDSVALMAISSTLMKLPGVEAASVVMATEANRENLHVAGLADVPEAGPNDLLVVVRAEPDVADEALRLADEALSAQPVADTGETSAQLPPTSIALAARRDPASNLALISVPGPYAAAEALKALQQGLHVMIFSDNVPLDHEVEIKQYAAQCELLAMGPDCGTALVNGVPLGFANAVRRGAVGVVGASGTGMQEVTCRVHQLGAGISQALGTGGHDLSAEVGALATRQALRALDADPDTEVIVLVSKPPAAEVAVAVLELVATLTTPVVVAFVGAAQPPDGGPGVHVAATLADAADLAVAVLEDRPVAAPDATLSDEVHARLRAAAAGTGTEQRYVRGIFSGGTFCYEAQLLCREAGIEAFSNTPVAGNSALADIWTSTGHTIIDMGDDAFTRGRPHPMIDPTLRDERLLAEAADPATAVLLLDVVLGYGAVDDPVTGLVTVLERCREEAASQGHTLPVVAHVCGTDDDAQHRSSVVAALRAADVLVAESNAQAARMTAALLTEITDRPRAGMGVK